MYIFSWLALSKLFGTQCRKGILRILLTQSVIFSLFQIGAIFIPTAHKFFYLDYLYLPFLFRLHWLVGVFFAIPMVLFDIYFSLDSANGLSLGALLGLIREIPHAGVWGYQLAAAGVSLFVILVAFVAWQYSQVDCKAAGVVFLALAVIYVPVKRMAKWPIMSTGLTAPVFYAVFWQDTFFFDRLNPGNMQFTALPERSWLAQNIHGEEKILSVLFESYGIDDTRPQINQYLSDTLRRALPGRQIETSVVGYQGSTVNGELRELCSVHTAGVMLDAVPAEYPCLPRIFAQAGYQTVGFHNNKGGFYDRLRWYPNVGLAHFVDKKAMLDKGYETSQFAFSAIADKDMATEISAWLKKNRKIFAHWITLDSHGPYNKILAPEVADCPRLGITEKAQCNYINMLQSTFAAIIDIARQNPDVKIVISGDHAPHFESVANPLEGKRLNTLYNHQQVPAIVIDRLQDSGFGGQ